jgi:universal stress protein E
MIIAECHQGARSRRWSLRPTDWELLRASPIPVLLLKGGRPYHRPLLLAAVDPAHAHAKTAALDSRIMAAASELGAELRGEVHLVHANAPSIVGLDPKVAAKRAASSWSTLTLSELQDQGRQAFEEFRARAGVRRTRAHLVDGNPGMIIPRLAQDLGAGIVVMGAVSRSALARAFIGNTAERVLDALSCDVLVVKPESAASGTRQQDREIRAVAGGRG